MDEMVFFNPGDAIANSRDFGEAVRGAQIYKAKDPYESSLIIAEDATNKKSFAVYFASDEKATSKILTKVSYLTILRKKFSLLTNNASSLDQRTKKEAQLSFFFVLKYYPI